MADRSTVTHDLVMLYLSQQDISGYKPKDLVNKYREIEDEIKPLIKATSAKGETSVFKP